MPFTVEMRLPATIALLSLLTSCSFGYEVTARYDRDHLVFDSEPGGWLSPDPCIYGDFSVLDGNRRIWVVEKDEERSTCPKGGDFPIGYGEAREGFITKIAPAKLVVGRIYTIQGGAGIHYRGSFRIGYAVANLTGN